MDMEQPSTKPGPWQGSTKGQLCLYYFVHLFDQALDVGTLFYSFFIPSIDHEVLNICCVEVETLKCFPNMGVILKPQL